MTPRSLSAMDQQCHLPFFIPSAQNSRMLFISGHFYSHSLLFMLFFERTEGHRTFHRRRCRHARVGACVLRVATTDRPGAPNPSQPNPSLKPPYARLRNPTPQSTTCALRRPSCGMDLPFYRSLGALPTHLPALATLTAAHMVSPPAWLPYLALSRSAGLRPASTGAVVVGGCALHALSTVLAAAGLAAAGGVAGALLGGTVARLGAAAALGAVGVWLVFGALVRGEGGLPGCCDESAPAGRVKVLTSPPPAGEAKVAPSAGAPGSVALPEGATTPAGPAPAAGGRAGLALLAVAALTPCVASQPLLVGLVAGSPGIGRAPALVAAGVVIWAVSTAVVGAAVALGGGLARRLGRGGGRLRVAERALFGGVLLVLAVVTATGGGHAHHHHHGSMTGGGVDAAMHAHHHHHNGMAGMGGAIPEAEMHAHHHLL